MKYIKLLIIWIKSLFARRKTASQAMPIAAKATPYKRYHADHPTILPAPAEKYTLKNNRAIKRGRKYQIIKMCDGTTRLIRHIV